jgi:DNA/RNA-binding domain of Phe-tRNA-synthetase-like protein
MKTFTVEEKVFDRVPDYCLGVVIAEGINNRGAQPIVTAMLDGSVREFAERFVGQDVREIPNIKAYREAFRSLDMNPNKFMCSIEALTKRVQKGNPLPHINPIVDLGNALSVKYQLALGAHDIDRMEPEGLAVRFSMEQDSFLPMGEAQPEVMPAGELVYVSGHTVKTRRWLWRQRDDGMITEETANVFFPIDGFASVNRDTVLSARDELAETLKTVFGCRVKTAYIDRAHMSISLI